MDDTAVTLLLDFQRTGAGFEALWDRIRPFVDGMVRGLLRKRLVSGAFGGDDEGAVAETMQEVALKLCELPRKDPRAWFDPARGPCDPARGERDPARGRGSMDALRGWLFGVCRSNVADYCRTWRSAGRKRKVLTDSALPLNQQSEFSSILKTAPATIEVDRRELEQIVNECVDALPDEELQTLIRLNAWEDLSVRDLDRRLGIHESTVQRRLSKARGLLREALEDRGVDASWIG